MIGTSGTSIVPTTGAITLQQMLQASPDDRPPAPEPPPPGNPITDAPKPGPNAGDYVLDGGGLGVQMANLVYSDGARAQAAAAEEKFVDQAHECGCRDYCVYYRVDGVEIVFHGGGGSAAAASA